MTALVSIITPCYNAEAFIAQTIKSVQEQTYKNWELIIVDDYSADKSYSIAEQYAKEDSRIICIKNPKNLGVAQTRNRAIESAKGEYIAFLDADDIWLPNKLQNQVTLMQKENISLCYTAYFTMSETGETLTRFDVPEQVNYSDMLKTSSIGTLTTIYNAKKLGKFYMSGVGHEDYIMKLQILKQIPYAKGIQEPLAKYRIHEQGLSNNKLHAAKWQWHIYRKIEKLSLLKSLYYFMHYAYFGVFKYRN